MRTFPLLAAALPVSGYAKTLAAWVQLIGPGRQASIRVIVPGDASCPTLTADGEPLAPGTGTFSESNGAIIGPTFLG